MPWNDLTPLQQNFLQKYLSKGLFDFLGNTHAKPENIEKTAHFEALETMLGEIRSRVQDIPADFVEKDMHTKGLGAVEALRESGDFEKAMQKAAPLLQDAERTLRTIGDNAEILRALAGGATDLAGATQEEITRLDGLKRAIPASLGATYPSKADLRTALTAKAAYEDEKARVAAAAKLRMDAKAAFDQALATARPKLQAIAGMNPAPYDRAPSHGEMVSAVADATALLDQCDKAATQAEHEAATAALTDWVKDEAALAGLPDKLLEEIKQILRDEYQGFEGRLKAHAATDIARLYLASDQPTLAPLKAVIVQDVEDIKAALDGRDVGVVVATLDRLDEIEAHGDAFADAEAVAQKNAVNKRLADSNVSETHRKAVTKLMDIDSDSAELVQDILKDTTGILGGAEVTTTFVAEKIKAAKEADKLWDETWDKLQEAKTARKKAREDIEALTEEQEQLEKQIAAAGDAVPEDLAQKLAAAKQAQTALVAGMAALDVKVSETKAANSAARQAYNDVKKIADAAEKQKMVLDAITFGPLSPDHGRAVDESTRKALIEVMEEDFRIGGQAMAIASTAKHPDAVLRCAKGMCDRVEERFEASDGSSMSESKSREYAEKLMAMSANFPIELQDPLDDYLDDDAHFNAAPDMYRGKTYNEDVKNRAASVSSALLTPDGDLDLDAGFKALADVMFHPDSLKYPTPELATHMFETMGFLARDDAAKDKLKNVRKPTSEAAQALVKVSTGHDASAQGDGDARQAVLNAMLTPVFQGNVGSCFATAGIVRLRKTDPGKALETFSKMIETGNYVPEKGVAVPLVQNVPADQDPLVRSLEYSAATACARADQSQERKDFGKRAGKGVDTLEDQFKAEKWDLVKLKIDAAISGAVTFRYNPEAKTDLADDGSSSKGSYELINKDTTETIDSKDKFVAAVSAAVLASLSDDDLVDGVTKADIENRIAASAFTDAMKRVEKKNKVDTEFMPWQLGSGGYTDAATETILGGDIETRGFLPESPDPDTSDEAARSRAVLGGFLEAYGERNDAMATMRTVGQHGFNALPSHPSLEPLKKGGKDKFAENLQKEVIDKGTALKNTAIPLDRAIFMFESEMSALAKNASGDAKAALEAAITAHRPTQPEMKPAEFKALIKTATTEYVNKRAEAAIAATKAKLAQDGKPALSAEEEAKQLADTKKGLGKSVDNLVSNRLINDLGAPQFVIADTNWGSGKEHTFFVFVPDPVSGEPKLFKRDDPSGTLSAVDKKWVDKQWARVE